MKTNSSDTLADGMATRVPDQEALDIIRKLRALGHEAYLVGGCVRDRLLGIPPKDYDVSTDATPQQILSLFPESQTVGAHFGVILVTGALDRDAPRW